MVDAVLFKWAIGPDVHSPYSKFEASLSRYFLTGYEPGLTAPSRYHQYSLDSNQQSPSLSIYIIDFSAIETATKWHLNLQLSTLANTVSPISLLRRTTIPGNGTWRLFSLVRMLWKLFKERNRLQLRIPAIQLLKPLFATFVAVPGRAFAMITTSCDESIRALIDDIPQGDPVAVWKALKEHLDTSKTRSGRIAIVRRFHRMRMSADSTVSEYISSLRETRKELFGSAEKITDETLLTHLLSTLPDSFSNIVDIITHKPIEEQTLASVTSDLIEYEKKLQERKEELGAGTNTANTMTDANALAASVQSRNRSTFRRTPYNLQRNNKRIHHIEPTMPHL
jgi:hypothetical protein